ncbi:MAG TPA: DUF4105 domain-containing protein [Hyphomicrobiaceae bacterium]|nr:DUF4105 domain-containing protein [Hyphomicrobiaceae bacterium]
MKLLAVLATLVVGGLIALSAYFFLGSRGHGLAWAVGWLTLTVIVIASGAARLSWPASAFWVAALAWGVWWATLTPSNNRAWASDVANLPSGALSGEIVTLTNVRNFSWKSPTEAVETWETRSYDLAKLTELDLFASYWSGETMAHLILSFGFTDGQRLAISIETRREKSETWSAFAGFFKSYELIYIAADERDVVKLRSNVRGEEVRLYRLKSTPEMRKRLFVQYINEMNSLVDRPRFYHTIWTNCTTQIAGIARSIGRNVPLDWRIIASGYVPNLLYDLELLDKRLPFPDLRRAANIVPRAKAADADPQFSELIRAGVPSPAR